MNTQASKELRRFNHLLGEINGVYHEVSVKLGLPDSVMTVLYTLCSEGDPCPLQVIVRQSGASKQTINSAIRRLEREEIIGLEAAAGRGKNVRLTEKGRELVRRKVVPIVKIEDEIYASWTWEELREHLERTERFLTALKEELKELGIEGRTYFHISDEPEKEHMENFRNAWEGVAKDLEGFQVMDALSDYDFYKEGLVRQPVCAVNHIKPFLEERPEKLWGYYCTAQCVDVTNRFIVLPGCRTRILGVQLYKYRLDGFLHWGYNFYNSEHSLYPIDPYRCTDAGGAFPSGDPFLVYPGKDGRPEGSVRQMLMDEAMSDYCAFLALEKLAGREKVLELIDEETVTFDEYPQDEDYLLGLRKKVNQAIKDALP